MVSQLLSGRRDIRIFFQPPQQIVIEKTRELSEYVGGLPVEGILKLNHFQLHDEMRLNDSGIEQVDIFYGHESAGRNMTVFFFSTEDPSVKHRSNFQDDPSLRNGISL